MEQPSRAEDLIKQGYNSKLLDNLFTRHIRRVHTRRSDDRFFSLSRPCPICDEYIIDLFAVKSREEERKNSHNF